METKLSVVSASSPTNGSLRGWYTNECVSEWKKVK